MGRTTVASGLVLAGLPLLLGCFQGPRGVAQAVPPAARIAPVAATLTTGRTAAFTGTVDGQAVPEVTWRVLEPGGGTVDAGGTYRAPDHPGVFTLQGAFKAVAGLTAAAKVTVVAPPAGDIQAPERVLAEAAGASARIQPVAGSTYHWTIAGGSITAGTDTPAITFLAGSGPKVVVACRVTNQAGDVLETSRGIPVAAPLALVIRPGAVTLTAGRAMKFGYELSGGISLRVAWSLGEPGAGSLDDAGHYVAPLVPGLYTVRVTSLDDPTYSATATVKVVPKPPEGMIAPATFHPGAQGLRALVTELPGMTYAWAIEGGTFAGEGTGARVVFNAGDGPELTLRCRITNEAGDVFTASKVLNADQSDKL